MVSRIVLIICCILNSAFASKLPSSEIQTKIFRAMRNEMIRLDGEGLIARIGRPETFLETTDRILLETTKNETIYDFVNSFQRLTATYTNLHSRASFGQDILGDFKIPNRLQRSIELFAEVSEKDSKYFANRITDKDVSNIIERGAELIAINKRPINKWLNENFLFCKYTLKIQCDREFEGNLLSLSLSWKGQDDLIYTFKHKNKVSDVKVKFSPRGNNRGADPKCDDAWESRYTNFKLVYKGFHTCLFEKRNDPSVALLRIQSFLYTRNVYPENPFETIFEEVSALEKIWLPKSGQYQNLIIDVLDNGGGNLPIPYYQILFQNNFQEQYVKFKKIPELEDMNFRNVIFWKDPSQEMLFQKYFSNGLWDSLKYGDFTPATPMFCSDPERPCDEGLFSPQKHFFKGAVHIMLNERCVSSCDGFVWALKKNLDAKLYGFYQAADSAFARIRIDAIEDAETTDGFRLELNDISEKNPVGFIVGQIVAISRSSDSEGNDLNGKPLPLDKFVPYHFGKFYVEDVLKAILK